MSEFWPEGRIAIFNEVHAERERQDEKWGEQNHPIRRYSEAAFFRYEHDVAKKCCDNRASEGSLSWYDILREEFWEVFAEFEPEKQRAELVQVAAVAISMIECIDRNFKKEGK
jgi:hypothetical protein